MGNENSVATQMLFESFVFDIHNLPYNHKNEMRAIIKTHGGKISTRKQNVTHMIVSPQELRNPNNYKVEVAKRNKINIVTVQWIKNKVNGVEVPESALFQTMNNIQDRISSMGNRRRDPSNLVNHLPTDINSFSLKNDAVPTISLLLPDSGSAEGGFDVAIMGLNFSPSEDFRVKFGSVDCSHYVFHGTTSIIVTVPKIDIPKSGTVLVAASNDKGTNFGFPLQFKFIGGPIDEKDEANTKIELVQSQINAYRKTIANIQRMETDLRQRVKNITGYVEPQSINDSDNTNEPMKKKLFDREVKIFISSPFRDIQEERDNLAKIVIPKLRKMCMERDVVLSYVDLRWGVTESQSESATTLLLCLREIENSDLFIGILGERYGWNISDEHDTGSNELLNRSLDMASREYPWVEDLRNLSITDIEMKMAIQERCGRKPSWFYFRDPYYADSVPSEKKNTFVSEGKSSYQKLQHLKTDIMQTEYPVRSYMRPKEMSEMFFEDMKEYLDERFPANITLAPEKRENFRHNIYARSLCRIYIPDENYYLIFDRYIQDDNNKPLLVNGDPGVGKSSLLANWCSRLKEHMHKDEILFEHYIGASSTSSDVSHIIWRTMYEISRQLGMNYQIPSVSDTKHLHREFSKWIQHVSTSYKNKLIIIIFDGLDQLIDRENALDLIWLPHTFPDNFKVIISSTTGHVNDVLIKRKYDNFFVENLSVSKSTELIKRYLFDTHSKRLESKMENLIAEARQTRIPRFLLTMLDDISLFGDFEDLEAKILYNLRAQTTSELYEIVFERLENDYSRDIIKSILGLIWSSKRGLILDSELRPILQNMGFEDSEWVDFVESQENILSDKGGMLNFSNQNISDAVENKYLKSIDQRHEFHNILANYFIDLDGLPQRKIEELPFQLEKSNNFRDLADFLADLRIFEIFYKEENRYEMLYYWRSIEKNTRLRCNKIYNKIISRNQFPSGIIASHLIHNLAKFLQSMNKYKAAKKMYLRAISLFEKASQRLNIAKVLTELSTLHSILRESDEARDTLYKAENIYIEERGPDAAELSIVLNKLGIIYLNTIQNFEEAKVILDRALGIAESAYGLDHIKTSDIYYSLGCSYLSLNNLQEAETCLLRSLRIKEKLLGDWDPEVSHVLNRMGTMYIEQDQYNDAEECFERSLQIREKKLGPEHTRVAQTLKHMISLYEIQEKYDLAITTGLRSLEITKKHFGPNHFHVSSILFRIGSIYFAKGDTRSAKRYVTDCINMRLQTLDRNHPDVLDAQHFLDQLIPRANQVEDVLEEAPIYRATQRRRRFNTDGPPPPPTRPHVIPEEVYLVPGLSNELRNFKKMEQRSQNLKRAKPTKTYESRDMAIKMMARNKRKVKFKSLW
eukprot:TRINITY_DN862_c0_g2_i1.p1 TRINITY_DN862_c0_g2~~TRINITY_DN862_c0_g2_i1.p1  ORF type:complete len:1369 (-),score=302.65 TRINITY_DN862_c0_g2_i1:28-4134(-)